MSKKINSLMVFAVASLLLAGHPTHAPAMATGSYGNQPLNDPAYSEWPYLVSVINDTHRVYSCWVNGMERLYFRGDTDALNDALQRFASVQAGAHEVFLLAGPATYPSIIGTGHIDYDWFLKFYEGASRIAPGWKGGPIWSRDPTLVVYIGGNIALDKIHIPKGITVLEISDIQKRYTQALQDGEEGWEACELVHLDPCNTASVAIITKLLENPDDRVRLNAVIAMKFFGKTAASSLPLLRQTAQTTNQSLKTETERAIADIEKAPAVDDQRDVLRRKISLFCKSLEHFK